ncbi:MAG: hypothetical protein WDW38_007713 [Sanguina aurantia]
MVFGAGPRATRDRRTGARAVSSPPLAAHILRAAGQIALGTESDVPGGCVVVPNMCRLRWEEAVDWMIQTGTHTTVHEWAPTEWLCFRAFAARGQNASRWWVSVPGTQHGSRPTLSVAAFDGRTRAHILRAAGQIALGTESDVPGGCVVVPNMCRLRWEEAVDWMIQTGTHTTVHEWAPTEWLCFRAFAARGQNASRWWVSVPGTQHGSRPTLSVAAFDGRTRGVPLARRRRHRPTRSLRGTPHTAADSGRRTAERH